MKYVITITTPDGKMLPVSIDSKNSVEAHRLAKQFAVSGAKIRVYPDTSTEIGIVKGALMVAHRTAIHAIQHGGTETEQRIEKELAAVNARCYNADTAERILQVIRNYSQDVQDYYSDAQDGLIQGIADGLDIVNQYGLAYSILNRAIQRQRAASQREISTEYIRDDGSDIVEVGTLLANIIQDGGKWIEAASADLTMENRLQLRKALVEIIALLSPVQTDIVRLLAMGYSQRAIAKQVGNDPSTINRNIAIIRGKAAEYFRDNAPSFADTYKTGCKVKTNESIETALRAKTGNRSEEAIARAKAKSKATQAARSKAYRERKKQKQAAQPEDQ